MKLDKISSIYPYITDVNDFELVVYTDASYAKLSDGYSSAGDIIFKKKIPKTVFDLSSTKNKCVVKSAMAVECLALLEELGNVFYLEHVPAVFYQIFIFNQMIALQKL